MVQVRDHGGAGHGHRRGERFFVQTEVHDPAGAQVAPGGTQDGAGVEAMVLIEVLVLGRHQGLRQQLRPQRPGPPEP